MDKESEDKKMKAPQVITIILFTTNVVMNLIKHGEPKDTKYNFWWALIATAIDVAILRWGGFFK